LVGGILIEIGNDRTFSRNHERVKMMLLTVDKELIRAVRHGLEVKSTNVSIGDEEIEHANALMRHISCLFNNVFLVCHFVMNGAEGRFWEVNSIGFKNTNEAWGLVWITCSQELMLFGVFEPVEISESQSVSC
jgi:hypothetical protein